MKEIGKQKKVYDFGPQAETELKLAGFFFFSLFAGMILALVYMMFKG